MGEKYFNIELKNIYEKFQTDHINGLTQEEADKRLLEDGPNEIPRASKGFIKIYLAPLFNWLIVIYLIASLILLIFLFFPPYTPPGQEEESSSLLTIILPLGIVLLNCMIAIFQQARATKKLNALRELSAPTATVIRGDQKQDVATKDIVKGDLLVLSQGDKIPADARIIESANLEVNEASLTGESEPAKKNSEGDVILEEDISIGKQNNMVFYGTYITTGNGKSIVVATGGGTEIGKISQGLEEAGTSEIPIRKKMNNFGKWLGLAVMGLWLVTLSIMLIIQWGNLMKYGSAYLGFLVVKSINSAMDIMPINLPLLTTVVLIMGVLAMAHYGVIVRNIASVDSLGRTSVVCSDKTGTLTKNQMCVQYIWVNNSLYNVSGSGYNPKGEITLIDDPKNLKTIMDIDDFPQLKLLLISGYLNNNSALVKTQVETGTRSVDTWSVVGSPTEGALLVLFQKAMGFSILDDYEHIREFPFDSKIKRMTKVFKKDGTFYSFTKGASEVLLPLCTRYITQEREVEFTDEFKNDALSYINKFAGQGYRILSLCYKKLNEAPSDSDESRALCESGMTYIGFVAILDPPREGVKDSVEQCHKAGVEVIMITGDSPNTARSIASQILIITREEELAVEGKDIKDYVETSDFNEIKVFARVSPKHKENIIKKYKSENRVVAMTGDGVNDALALNLADAGLAMGITGTDVAKEASDMVISDDSFNSIVEGIKQGRGIFAKIRAVVFFYICVNLFEGIVAFILSVILGLPYFLDPSFITQWALLAVTVHMFPGLILTFDTISDDVMNDKPKDSEEILSKETIYLMLVFGALLATCMVLVYILCLSGIYPVFDGNLEFGAFNDSYLYTSETMDLTPGINLVHAKTLTMLMVVLFFCESFLVLQIRRPNKSLIQSTKEDSTKFMYLLIGLLFAALLAIMYIPGLQTDGINFKFMYLTALDWLVCFLISLICIVTFEIVKWEARKRNISF